jgi:hypothetical protein
MLPLAIMLIIGGYLLVYSGVRNVSPADQIRGAFA